MAHIQSIQIMAFCPTLMGYMGHQLSTLEVQVVYSVYMSLDTYIHIHLHTYVYISRTDWALHVRS